VAGLAEPFHGFHGITVDAPPPLLSRLWFVERELAELILWGQHVVCGDRQPYSFMGRWTVDARDQSSHRGVSLGTVLPGTLLHYEDWDRADWSAAAGRVTVWRLTDTRIGLVGGGIEWRLGIWPD
jgi:hypothetical protein